MPSGSAKAKVKYRAIVISPTVPQPVDGLRAGKDCGQPRLNRGYWSLLRFKKPEQILCTRITETRETARRIVLATKSPTAVSYLISHLPDALIVDGVRANVIDWDLMPMVPPVRPGPADHPKPSPSLASSLANRSSSDSQP
jgi:hypothetical protein